jgi:hypothetical protein
MPPAGNSGGTELKRPDQPIGGGTRGRFENVRPLSAADREYDGDTWEQAPPKNGLACPHCLGDHLAVIGIHPASSTVYLAMCLLSCGSCAQRAAPNVQAPSAGSPGSAEPGAASPTSSQHPPEHFEIGLGAYRFDPLEYESAIPAALRAPESQCADRPCYYVVQFSRPLLDSDRVRLTGEFGLNLKEYVPQGAYVERIEPGAMRRLCRQESVRACVPYQPGFKLSPYLREPPHTFQKGNPVLLATLFDDADLQAVSSDLSALGGQVEHPTDHRPLGGSLRIVFAVDLAQLERVAHIEGIRWVEKVGRINVD